MKKRETKLQVQSILATVVMGMNLVNTAAPAVAVAMTEQQEPAPKQSVSEAQQEEMQSYAYEVLPILAGYVDEMVFSKAEAASSYSVGVGENRSIASTDDYDSVYVASGGTCTIDSNRAKINVVDGGSLNIGNNIGSVTVSGGNVSVVSTYAVYVNDQSIVSDTELTGRLLLIDDQSGRLNFEGITANNGGLWDATPVLNKETNQWYLSRIVKTANNDTKVLLFDAENSYAMWRNTADSSPPGGPPRGPACAAAWVSCMEVLSMTTGFGLVRRPDASVAAVTKAAMTCTNWVMIKYLPIKVFTVQLLITVMAQVAMPTAAVRTN